MLNCRYKNNTIYCDEYIGKGDQAVDKIEDLKTLSGRHQLFCCDEGCNQPIQFCHGEIKGSYFRHFPGHENECEYNKYSNGRVKFKELKAMLYQVLNSRGLNVSVDKKLLPHHFTDLVVKFPDGNIVAIELTDRRPSGLEWKRIHESYKSNGINDLWILQTAPSQAKELAEMYFIDMLNVARSNQKCAIYFDTDTKNIHIKTILNFNVAMPELIRDNAIEVTLDMNDFSFDSHGNICGKCSKILDTNAQSILKKYIIDEEREIIKRKKVEIDRKKRYEQEQADKKHNEEKIEMIRKEHLLRLQKEKEQRDKEEKQRQLQYAQKIQNKEKKYQNDDLPKIRNILLANGIEIDESKFERFKQNNDNWLRNHATEEQSKIIVAKYNNS